ncbi:MULTISPECIES: response regulator transcription factor [unclassified Streptomyces]|uniref:response regulator transcription factor n=1 Tax=unclassified Streptomyces TaxID=2593676 RepID=UPI0009392967|nr:response regulator transcription factor [Streptomyces sp. TSRI0107]OKJ74658.1 transcriptional regulator [Streptomyces sp. TSRI0107]
MHDPTPNPLDDLPHATPPAPLRVVVADDNPVVRAGLGALLADRADITVVAEGVDGRSAWEATREHRPDVVLLDIRMPGMDGISALPYLVPLAPVLMLTYSHEPETVQEALHRGARGYLVYGEFTTDQLVTAIRDTKGSKAHLTPTAAGALLAQLRRGRAQGFEQDRGQAPGPATGPRPGGPHDSRIRHQAVDRWRFELSRREAEIMDLIASGMTNQQIAATCFIAEKTVKNHINHIFAKLHSTRRSEAVAKWLGMAPDPASRWPR